jgi:hypothetical protein
MLSYLELGILPRIHRIRFRTTITSSITLHKYYPSRLFVCKYRPNAAMTIADRHIPKPTAIAILSLPFRPVPDGSPPTSTVGVGGKSVELVLKGVGNTVVLVSVCVDDVDEAGVIDFVVDVGSCGCGGRAVVVPSRLEVNQSHTPISNQGQ